MKVVQGGTVSRLLKDVQIPEMFHARQTFPREAINPQDIPAILESGNRTLAGPTVPPGGLYMTKLWYDEDVL